MLAPDSSNAAFYFFEILPPLLYPVLAPPLLLGPASIPISLSCAFAADAAALFAAAP